MRSSAPKPTDSELAILRVLWLRGPSSVRDVHEVLSRSHTTGYTTVLKMLQIMTDKGLVVRDETSRAHVYEATLSRESTQMGLLQDLLDKAFDGSAQRLVMRALTEAKTSPEELAEIRKLLDELEGEQS